jgi:hypothetical protein
MPTTDVVETAPEHASPERPALDYTFDPDDDETLFDLLAVRPAGASANPLPPPPPPPASGGVPASALPPELAPQSDGHGYGNAAAGPSLGEGPLRAAGRESRNHAGGRASDLPLGLEPARPLSDNRMQDPKSPRDVLGPSLPAQPPQNLDEDADAVPASPMSPQPAEPSRPWADGGLAGETSGQGDAADGVHRDYAGSASRAVEGSYGHAAAPASGNYGDNGGHAPGDATGFLGDTGAAVPGDATGYVGDTGGAVSGDATRFPDHSGDAVFPGGTGDAVDEDATGFPGGQPPLPPSPAYAPASPAPPIPQSPLPVVPQSTPPKANRRDGSGETPTGPVPLVLPSQSLGVPDTIALPVLPISEPAVQWSPAPPVPQSPVPPPPFGSPRAVLTDRDAAAVHVEGGRAVPQSPAARVPPHAYSGTSVPLGGEDQGPPASPPPPLPEGFVPPVPASPVPQATFQLQG